MCVTYICVCVGTSENSNYTCKVILLSNIVVWTLPNSGLQALYTLIDHINAIEQEGIQLGLSTRELFIKTRQKRKARGMFEYLMIENLQFITHSPSSRISLCSKSHLRKKYSELYFYLILGHMWWHSSLEIPNICWYAVITFMKALLALGKFLWEGRVFFSTLWHHPTEEILLILLTLLK